MLVSSALGAGMSVVVYGLADSVHWTVVALGRLSFGGIAAASIAVAAGAPLLGRVEPWAWVKTLASAAGVPLAFYAYAMLPPGDAVSVMSTGPLWGVAIGSILQGRLPSLRVVASAVVAVIGIALMHRPTLAVAVVALLAALGNAFLQGFGVVASAKVSHTRPSVLVTLSTVGALLSTSAVMAMVFPFSYIPAQLDTLSLASWVGLVVVGLLVTMSNLTANQSLLSSTVEVVAPLMFLSAPMAAALEWWIWDHPISLQYLFGMCLVLAAVFYGAIGSTGGGDWFPKTWRRSGGT